MQDLVEKLTELLLSKDMMLVTAESCTGGLLAAAMTHKAGASKVFERGFVTYSNEAKMEELEVPFDVLEAHGAVSEQAALSMAEGALKNSRADLSVSITGIAGPDGGSEDKPVGTTYIGTQLKGQDSEAKHYVFEGDRVQIQAQSLQHALEQLIQVLE